MLNIFSNIIIILFLYLKHFYIQCNPDIRELSGPENKYLVPYFLLYTGLVFFVLVTQALIWDQIKSLLYPGYTENLYVGKY